MGRTVKSRTENSTALLLGLGYTARALVPVLKARGYDIIGTSRSAEKARALSAALGIKIIEFSGFASAALKTAIAKADIIISSAPPADDGRDPVITALPDIAKIARHCHWAGYLSATSVYGDREGRWAFEDELLFPTTQRGRNRISAELAWLESGLPVHVFRLAGIYGPEILGQSRNAFQRLKTGRVKAVIKPGHLVNRIHVEDIATALTASIDRPDPVQVYNIADGNPAPPQDVLEFAADLIGEARPKRVDYKTANLSAMARSFYSETKRIDISRARSELGWTPQYPTYRDGLCDIYRRETYGPKSFLLAGHIIVPDEDLEDIRRLLSEHKKATLAEPGCLRFDVFQDLGDKHKFHVFEAFKSEKAFQDHKARTAGTDWVKVSANIERFYTVSKAR
ncbi:MAG: NAD(P)-binding domain-containing protein [Hellea sp.]|nr:NAD(P)-binding domain-containing protein [Hellea sp.]